MSFSTLEGMFSSLRGCCLHDPQWLPEDVAEQLTQLDTWEDWDSESITVVRLRPDGYGLITEWSDSSGHGCRCDAMTVREPTLGRLLAHLTDRELEKVLRGDRDA